MAYLSDPASFILGPCGFCTLVYRTAGMRKPDQTIEKNKMRKNKIGFIMKKIDIIQTYFIILISVLEQSRFANKSLKRADFA